MKHFSRTVAYLVLTTMALLCVAMCVPQLAQAQGTADATGGGSLTGITFDCGVNSSGQQTNTDANAQPIWGNCTYADLLSAINKVINVGIKFALAFSVVIIAYAGFRYMMSRGNPGELTKVHKMFWTVGEGIIWLLLAWLIVHLIVSALTTTAVQQVTPIQ